MTSVYDLKPRFQALLRPICRALVKSGVRPNHVTLVALVGSLMVGAFILGAGPMRVAFLALPIWLLLRMALNALDGMMAREHAMSSRLGAVLNEMGDVAADVGLYLPLAVLAPGATWAAVAFAFTASATETSGILAQAMGAGRRYDGPMGKSDRALLVGAMGLVAFAWPGATIVWDWVLWIGTALALWTCVNRLKPAVRNEGSGR
jgi:CDP-diacylglycerol--glycerol-3-phosphate 3-phosphatidyltransferase